MEENKKDDKQNSVIGFLDHNINSETTAIKDYDDFLSFLENGGDQIDSKISEKIKEIRDEEIVHKSELEEMKKKWNESFGGKEEKNQAFKLLGIVEDRKGN